MTTHPYDDPEADELAALGIVVEEDRGSLPFALLHGEALVVCAAWALGEAGVTLVDSGTPWGALVEAGLPLVLHDPLCPAVPAELVRRCVAAADATGAVVVAVRPVTDTVKRVHDGVVGETVDREALRMVASPIVLPATVVAALDGLPATGFAALAEHLAARWPVELVEAPPEGRRVASAEDVRLLEALTSRSR